MSQTVLSSVTIDDTSSNVTYAGAAWTVHTNVQSIFHLYNNSDTFTDVQYATATVKFYGNAIEYWGNRGPYHGPCQVSVDGAEVATVNSHATADDTPILLWSSNQLSLGDHELQVKVLDPSYPNVCEVDRFVANVTSNPTNSGSYPQTTGNVSNNQDPSNSPPPIAAIAGGVGGAAVLCLLLVGFWLYRRRKNNKAKKGEAIITSSKLGKAGKAAATQPLLEAGPASPSPRHEKSGFGVQPGHPNQPSSYVSSSPPASSYNAPSTYNPGSPPPTGAGFNPHMLAYSQGTMSPVAPSATTMTSMPNSPNTVLRPMSAVSSTSAAPTMSYYPSGPPTNEAGGFPGYFPQPQQQQYAQPQQYPQQQYQQYEQPQQQQQQQYQQHAAAPVWATSESPGVPVHAQQPSVPSPTPSPAPAVMQPSPSPTPAPTAFPPEKAQYKAPPEKSAYSGAQQPGSSTAGASGSSAAPAVTPAGASGSGQNEEILSPAVPDLPPPAYQF